MVIQIAKYFKKEDIRISGLYFLISQHKIVYIGKSTHLLRRAEVHKFKFDTIRFIQCPKNRLDKNEKRWINKFKPIENRQYNTNVNFVHIRKNSAYGRYQPSQIISDESEKKINKPVKSSPYPNAIDYKALHKQYLQENYNPRKPKI